ncbi:MAG: hypothetical protein ACREOO_04910 [bacterium]
MRTLLACAVMLFLLASACQKKNPPTEPAPLANDSSTFTMIQRQVFDVSCTSSSCHTSATPAGGLSLAAGESYANLFQAEPVNAQAKAAGLKRVTPGRPDLSFLMKKLSGPAPNEGDLMPRGTSGLSSIKLDAIREWIKAGAPQNEVVPSAPNLELAPPDPGHDFVAPAAPPDEQGFQVHLGPFFVEPGKEREVLSSVRVTLPPDFVVNRVEVSQPEGSHHFIVYHWKTNDAPPPGIRDFNPIDPNAGGAIFKRDFVAGTQTPYALLEFPAGVGIPLPEQLTLELNSHFVNTRGERSLKAEVYVNFYRAPAGTVTKRAKVLFENWLNIFVPPGSSTTTGTNWFTSQDINVLMLSSHMHRHGKRFTIHHIQNNQVGELLYDSLTWNDPKTAYFNPPLLLRAGEGLRYEATYTNDDKPFPLRFGFTAENDEMCIMLGYYY